MVNKSYLWFRRTLKKNRYYHSEREGEEERERESIIIRVIFFVEKFKLTTGLVQLVSRVGVFNDHDDDGKEQQ